MKRRRKIALWILNVVATLFGGWLLTYLIAMAPFNMPYPVDAGIRWFLNIAGHNELANADDMEVLAFFVYLIFSLIVAGMAVFILNRLVFSRWSGRGSAAP